MDIYKIADLYIGIENHADFTKEYLKDYLVDSDYFDFTVSVTEEMVKNEEQISIEKVPYKYYEITAILRDICSKFTDYDCFFLHCSSLLYEGKAYVFTAKSGTGKSTHARMWREVFKDKVTMINDDKPIVRLIGDTFYIYGTPWNGKHHLSNNIKAPIKAVYYLSQAKTNKATKCDSITAISKLLSQTVLPDNKDSMHHLLDMLSDFVTTIPVLDLECNISYDAVHTALNSLKEI